MKLTELLKKLINSPHLALVAVAALAALTASMVWADGTDQSYSPSHRYNVPSYVLAVTVTAMQPSIEDIASLLANLKGDTP